MKNEMSLLKEIKHIIESNPSHSYHSGINVFRILGVEGKEVIMCRFLAELLDPNGEHNCGTLFLKSFCEDVIDLYGQNQKLLNNTVVTKEYRIDTSDRRIDIVISNYEHFIPIEVKIYAEDQKNQCLDYYRHAVELEKDQNTKIVYLTRYGSMPSEYSRGNLNASQIKCIGWKKDIIPWLEKTKDSANGETRDLIEQYMEIIYQIVGGRNEEIMNQCIDMITSTVDNFGAAIEIEKAVKHAKLMVLTEVFKEFEMQMEDESRIQNGKPVGSYCTQYHLRKEEQAEYFYYKNKTQRRYYDMSSTATYPGINYVVEDADYNDSNIKMWFRIEVEWNLYAGLVLFNMKDEPKYDNKLGAAISPIPENLYCESEKYFEKESFQKNQGWWLTYYYSNGKQKDESYLDVPDFKNMNVCAISLADPDIRKEYVKQSLLVFEEKIFKKLNLL